MKLDVSGVSWAVDGAQILSEVVLTCAPGTFIGLIGPNGSGKTTLLRCVYRVLHPNAGIVSVDGADVWDLSARDAARRIGVVLQERPEPTEFSVREIVLMGRAPHKRLMDGDTAEDLRIVDRALTEVGLSDFALRTFDTLSGGEKQRALVARALVQQPRLLVLDEPTSHLDIAHQLEVLALVRSLRVTTIAALHDLNLAASYCDELVMLKAGAVVARGTPEAVLTPTLIHEVYGVSAEIVRHPRTGKMCVVLC